MRDLIRALQQPLVLLLLLPILAAAQLAMPGETPRLPQGEGLAPAIMSASQRVALSLNGEWRHIPDPYDSGSLTHLSRPLNDGWWRDRERTRPDERIEYDFSQAAPLQVPGDWNSQRDDLFFYEGTVWYQKDFSLEAGASKRYFIHFGAVNRHADVWLNGEYLGSHHVGFTPFAFEITGQFKATDNSLVVRVSNKRRPEDVPAMRSDWWNYGGITREVAILETPSTFIRAWEIQLTPDGSQLAGWIQVEGPQVEGNSSQISMGRHGIVRTSIPADSDGFVRFFAPYPKGMERWSPASPTLHELEFSLSSGDRVADSVGFRTIGASGRDILLNDEPVFLRGVCLHEEAPDRAGRAWSEEDAQTLLGWAKNLGCNYVRLAHYTHNEHMLRVADELGLLVWAEIPVYWVLDFENSVTQTYASTHLSEMIERDRNRASVIIWSVGNENEANDTQTALRRELAGLARELDPSRLISAACFVRMTRGEDGRLNGIFVDDPFGEFADILAINEYIGWYHDSTDQLSDLNIETSWKKPLLFSEFGVGVKQGLHGDSDEVWTEEFGARFYADQLEWCSQLRKSGSLQGLSPWILKDFRSPRRPLAQIQDWYNRKGLMSETGVPKEAFRIVQRQYLKWADEN